MWILIALATNSYLGTYDSHAACQAAIRDRLVVDIVTPALMTDPALVERAKILVAQTQQYQTDYICQPKGVDNR